jgi:hypothetical protein
MQKEIQGDFFEDDKSALKSEIEKIRHTLDSVRKGIFARHVELSQLYLDLSKRMEELEKNACCK